MSPPSRLKTLLALISSRILPSSVESRPLPESAAAEGFHLRRCSADRLVASRSLSSLSGGHRFGHLSGFLPALNFQSLCRISLNLGRDLSPFLELMFMRCGAYSSSDKIWSDRGMIQRCCLWFFFGRILPILIAVPDFSSKGPQFLVCSSTKANPRGRQLDNSEEAKYSFARKKSFSFFLYQQFSFNLVPYKVFLLIYFLVRLWVWSSSIQGRLP